MHALSSWVQMQLGTNAARYTAQQITKETGFGYVLQNQLVWLNTIHTTTITIATLLTHRLDLVAVRVAVEPAGGYIQGALTISRHSWSFLTWPE
jgi:hypothetical protein